MTRPHRRAIRTHRMRTAAYAEAWLSALDAGMGYDAAASFDALVRELRWWKQAIASGERIPTRGGAPASDLYRYQEERDVRNLARTGQRVGDPVVDAWLRRGPEPGK